MRRTSVLLVLGGIAAYVAPYVFAWIFFATTSSDAFPDWLISTSSSLGSVGTALVLFGIAMRAFATSFLAKRDETQKEAESDYRFFCNTLLLGLLVWWFYVWPIVGLALLLSPNWLTVILAILAAIAFLLAIGSLIFARSRRKTDLNRAVTILKVPLYYGAIVAMALYILYGAQMLLA